MTDLHSALGYFVESLIPAYEELVARLQDGTFGAKRDLQAVGIAAERCLHMADYICRDPNYGTKIAGSPRSTAYVGNLTTKYPWFPIARDIANVFKHRKVSRTDNPTLTSMDAIEEAIVLVKHEDDDGPFYVAEKIVLVRLLNGEIYQAEDVVRGCIAEWASEMQALGIMADFPFGKVRKWRAERVDFPEGTAMNVLFDHGMPVQFRHVLRVYDAVEEKIRRRRIDEEFVTTLHVAWTVRPSRFDAAGQAQEGHYTMNVNFPAGVPEPPGAP
jgi:hypothetical protein